MSAAVLIEVLKAVKEVKDSYDTIDDFQEKLHRIERGEDPFPKEEKARRLVADLKGKARHLGRIAREGLPAPDLFTVALDELADPARRSAAGDKLRGNLTELEAWVGEARDLVVRLKDLRREAGLKQKAARDIARIFLKMAEKMPMIMTTANNAAYLEYSMTFERVAGALGDVGRQAGAALEKVQPQLQEQETSLLNLRTNLNTFGI